MNDIYIIDLDVDLKLYVNQILGKEYFIYLITLLRKKKKNKVTIISSFLSRQACLGPI